MLLGASLTDSSVRVAETTTVSMSLAKAVKLDEDIRNKPIAVNLNLLFMSAYNVIFLQNITNQMKLVLAYETTGKIGLNSQSIAHNLQ
ncbi:hypothetical protein NBRC116583_35460 [Arenicella sp. 4NH20-0111]